MTDDIEKIENQAEALDLSKECQTDSKTDDYSYVDKTNAVVGFIDSIKSFFK